MYSTYLCWTRPIGVVGLGRRLAALHLHSYTTRLDLTDDKKKSADGGKIPRQMHRDVSQKHGANQC